MGSSPKIVNFKHYNSFLSMNGKPSIKLSDYDFPLPEELIAQTPPARRGDSRLMIVDRKTGNVSVDSFSNITEYLHDNPLMVLNDTKVLSAKICGKFKETGKSIEALLVREIETNLWEALVKGLGKMKIGTRLLFDDGDLVGELQEKVSGRGVFRFSGTKDVKTILDRVGFPPLPPYIRRDLKSNDVAKSDEDRQRYQTVYAREAGAVAAPTAGLHFTNAALEKIKSQGIDIATLTLHVGPGTFQPVRSEYAEDHVMEGEFYKVAADAWNQIFQAKKDGRCILAVGTTTTKVLESLDFEFPVEEDRSGWTNRFIYPGHSFNTVGRLLTNFHLPKSTLFLLINSFAKKPIISKSYDMAVKEKFKFYSYGDAMLIL